MNAAAQQVITRLGLAPLPVEGGFFRSLWTSASKLPSGRGAASSIYFLMTPDGFSALHRMAVSEEIWHFYSGDAVKHVQFDPHQGRVSITRLGPDVLGGELPQLLVPGGVWQGACLAPGGSHGWALIGCIVSPAWDPADFELGDRHALGSAFPGNDGLVRELTR
ncbi:MAG: cupin domain-containing protein [Opitutaceae bacterium]